MSPSPWSPELSTPDPEDEENPFREQCIEALFRSAQEAKPKADCLCLIGLLLGNESADAYVELVKSLRPQDAREKCYTLEAMVINKRKGYPASENQIREFVERKP